MYNNFDNNNNNRDKYNEFSFYPENQQNNNSNGGKIAILIVIAFVTLVAVGTVIMVSLSLAANKNLVSENGDGTNSLGASVQASQQNASSSTENTVVRTDIPTIIQLSTPEDALSIPEIVEKVSPSVVGISCVTYQGTATGTGIIMSEDGYIITNALVVEGGSDFQVVLSKVHNSATFCAGLIGADTQTGIAVLKIDA